MCPCLRRRAKLGARLGGISPRCIERLVCSTHAKPERPHETSNTPVAGFSARHDESLESAERTDAQLPARRILIRLARRAWVTDCEPATLYEDKYRPRSESWHDLFPPPPSSVAVALYVSSFHALARSRRRRRAASRSISLLSLLAFFFSAKKKKFSLDPSFRSFFAALSANLLRSSSPSRSGEGSLIVDRPVTSVTAR